MDQFIGGTVVALFGAPVTHEDDAERAVRAALTIHEWLTERDSPQQARIAVATGEALVNVGAQASEAEMPIGDVVNTATRLHMAAPVIGVFVEEGGLIVRCG